MSTLEFIPLDEDGFSVLRSWFSDQELQKRLEYPTPLWFDYVCNEANVYAWLINEGDFPVGHLQVDIQTDGTAYIGFYVNPELRKQGYGRRILNALITRPEVSTVGKFIAMAEVDNLASQRCLQSAGFLLEGPPDAEGFLSLVHAPQK